MDQVTLQSLFKNQSKNIPFFLDVFHGVVIGLLPLLHGFGYLFKVNVFPVTATNKIKSRYVKIEIVFFMFLKKKVQKKV